MSKMPPAMWEEPDAFVPEETKRDRDDEPDEERTEPQESDPLD